MTETHVVAVGNAFDGTSLYGPFASFDDAQEFAASVDVDTDWYIIELHKPEGA